MLKKRRKTESLETQRLQMTPLIDVVFLLLTFFIVSFKIIMPEGDFGIKMPQAGASTPMEVQPLPVEPVQVRLTADQAGNLTDIRVGSNSLGPDPKRLREQIIQLVGTAPTQQERENLEAIIDYDRNLKYQYTVDALTAISGYLSEDKMIPLIDKINFAKK
jgi:biopolymer transport protein ExbD